MTSKNKSFFWASYADLMTSLFFVMIVLFIISLVELRSIGISSSEMDRLRFELDSLRQHNKMTNITLDSIRFLANATQTQINKINEINESTKDLDTLYFVYDPAHKKHKLRFDVKFATNASSIHFLLPTEREKLLSVGNTLQSFLDKVSKENPQIQYLLVIEGQASKDKADMDYNYELSYRRAKNLKKYWDDNGIIFNMPNCEVLICGSGDGTLSGTGLMREANEKANQRFLIHILPKPGKIE